MVTLLTDYTKQRRTLNSADDVGSIEWHNGDEVLLMDVDAVLIFSEEDNNWHPVPTGGGGGGVHAIIGTSVSSSNSMVIPKEDGYDNFFAYVAEPDADYFSTSGKAMSCFRLSWMGIRVGGCKNGGTSFPPVSMAGSLIATAFVTDTSSSVSVKFNNPNGAGMLSDGTPITYILW